MYARPGSSAGLLSQSFIDVAELWAAGLLRSDSTVWLNATAPAPALWALTGRRSQYLYVHRTSEPGYVRLTAGRARWARTFDDTGNGRAMLDLVAKTLPGGGPGDDKEVCLVIIHRQPERGLAVIDDSRRAALTGGAYSKGNVSVVDLGTYAADPAAATAVASEFDRSRAAYNGVLLMTEGLSAADRELVVTHHDAFTFDIDDDQLTRVNQYRQAIDDFGAQFAGAIFSRLSSATNHAT